jgi:glucokinase
MRRGQLIGVDVGGTKVAVATLEDQRLGESLVRPTEASSADQLIEELVASVEAVRGPSAVAVGVGVPSVVEFATGHVRSSVNVPLADVDLRPLLQDRLGLPVFVDNDATVAALGEAFDDAGRPMVQNLVLLTVGTGIGGGLVLGGRVYRAALGKLVAAGRPVDGHDAVNAARDGDPDATAALRLLGERLGIGIANAINTFDPDVVAVGGGVSVAGELLLGPAREVARRFALPGVGERTEIRPARHGRKAGVRGAALLAGLELARADGAVRPEVERA